MRHLQTDVTSPYGQVNLQGLVLSPPLFVCSWRANFRVIARSFFLVASLFWNGPRRLDLIDTNAFAQCALREYSRSATNNLTYRRVSSCPLSTSN